MHFMLFSLCFSWCSVFASNHELSFQSPFDKLNSLVAAAPPMKPSEKKRFVKTANYETDGNRHRQQEIDSKIQHSEWRAKMANYINALEARSERNVLDFYGQLAQQEQILSAPQAIILASYNKKIRSLKANKNIIGRLNNLSLLNALRLYKNALKNVKSRVVESFLYTISSPSVLATSSVICDSVEKEGALWSSNIAKHINFITWNIILNKK